jgi:chemotaxis response regulator CheB
VELLMKTYEEFLQLDESSLSRIASKIEKGGVAHISAERADKSKKENKERSKQLRKDIRGAGLPGPTKVEGQYKEAGQDKPSKEETSVVSSGKKGKRAFKKLLKKLANKYDQDSVLIQKDKDSEGKLHPTTKAGKQDLGKWDGKVGKMKPGTTGDMQTRIKGKTYTYG